MTKNLGEIYLNPILLELFGILIEFMNVLKYFKRTLCEFIKSEFDGEHNGILKESNKNQVGKKNEG